MMRLIDFCLWYINCMFEFLFFIGFILAIVIVLSPIWLLYIAGTKPELFKKFWEKVKKPITIIAVILIIIFALYQHISMFIESPRGFADAIKDSYLTYFVAFILLFVLSYVFMGVINNIRAKFEKEDNYSVAIRMLNKYKEKFNNPLFNEEIAFRIKRILDKGKIEFNRTKEFNKPLIVEQFVVGAISNYTGDLLESGNFHLYRGVLSPAGEKLLEYYDFAMAQLKKLGGMQEDGSMITDEYIKQERKVLLENIKNIG